MPALRRPAATTIGPPATSRFGPGPIRAKSMISAKSATIWAMSSCVVCRWSTATSHPDEGMRPIVGYLVVLPAGLIAVAAGPWIPIGFL